MKPKSSAERRSHKLGTVVADNQPQSAPSAQSKLELMSKTLFAPFSHKKEDSTRILSDRQPSLHFISL